MLPNPLRDRFGFTAFLEYYEPADLEQVIQTSSRKLGVEIEGDALSELAKRSRGTPRIANRLLRRTRDFASVGEHGVISRDVVIQAMELFGVDQAGLDRVDNQLLRLLGMLYLISLPMAFG